MTIHQKETVKMKVLTIRPPPQLKTYQKLKTQEKTQKLKEKTQGLSKFLLSSGTKPCVLLLKTHSSW